MWERKNKKTVGNRSFELSGDFNIKFGFKNSIDIKLGLWIKEKIHNNIQIVYHKIDVYIIQYAPLLTISTGIIDHKNNNSLRIIWNMPD